MDQVAVALSKALDFVNLPHVKTMLLMLGGWVWNTHRDTVNKAIPALVGAASILTTLAQVVTSTLGAAFPEAGVSPAAYEAVAGKGSGFWSGAAYILVGTILPPIIAVGAHSWPKNLREWVLSGCQLVRDRGRI